MLRVLESTRACSKVSRLKQYLPWTSEILTFKIVPLGIQTLISAIFPIGQSTSEYPLDIWSYAIIFLLMFSTSSNFTFEINFQLRKKKTLQRLNSGGHYAILHFVKKKKNFFIPAQLDSSFDIIHHPPLFFLVNILA